MHNSRWKKFFSYYKPHLGKFSLVLLCSLIGAGVELVMPLFAQHIADTSFGEAARGVSPGLLGLMCALALIELGANYYKDIHGHSLGAQMENELRQELYDHLQKLPFSFYDKHPVGDLMSRLTGDLLELAELYHHGPEDYVVNALTCLGALAILFPINAKLTLLLLLFMVVLGVWTWRMNARVERASALQQSRIGQINAHAQDALQGIRTVQSYSLEGEMSRRFAGLAGSFYDARVGIYRAEGYAWQGMSLISRFIRIAAMFVGGLLAMKGELDTAGFVAFLLYAGYLIEPVRQLAWMATQFHRGMAGFGRVMDVLEIEPEIADGAEAKPCARLRGEISLENVHFSYGEGLPEVLCGVSLRVAQQETVALVGASGIGKTTLLSLIPRFYEAQQGRVCIDGRDVRSYRLEDLRGSIAIVRQESALFSGSVLENIRMGRPQATREEVVEAAKLADADGFIRALPEGYDSDVGPQGVRLSGGQRQRICIARAFLKDAPILLLDEATSALDGESEAEVQRSLERLRAGRTTIIVAHRLSTVRNADRICVLDASGVCEQGTHEELLQKNAAYAALYRQYDLI
ncbi:MAG: ABC transporter ATP-binding protein [Eubacteriales bacterium]|nr:ABC transporter ATP-binding protein [Eubacteriales bacterium]